MKRISTAFLIVLALTNIAVAGEASVVLEVEAGKSDRTDTPLIWELPKQLQEHSAFQLTRIDTNQPVAVQLIAGKPPRVAWLLGETLKAGDKRQYRLAATKNGETAAAVQCQDLGKKLLITVGDKPVLYYNHATVLPPNPDEPYYARSGYIHPLVAPDGTTVTDDFAPDHVHQHGVMFAWTNTTFEGRDINFWDQKNQTAKIEHIAVESIQSGPVFGGFTATLRHSDLTAPDGPKPVLDETWTVRVYNLGREFLFDIQSTQSCASASPLVINKYHYGGMAIRGRRDWLKPGQGDFLTSEGKTRAEGNHSRPHWVDIHGLVDGNRYGVTVYSHPSNFRSPQPVRLHPSKPYFVFAPLVLGPFRIEPGKPLVSKYRYSVHTGQLSTANAERVWQDYSSPPQIRMVSQSDG